MAASFLASSLLAKTASSPIHHHDNKHFLTNLHHHQNNLRVSKRRSSFKIQAAKLPSGVVFPKAEPKFQPPFLGFTRTAEIWNSRACMIGLIGTFIVELIIHRGILQVIGVEVGKGLDIPL